uniref:Phosphoribosylglycinamide formyltransferase n=1 Tax=Candidatus Kentrum eta TaxID=2126337 RepID=A0A450VFY6_9GAMM|nr:MAG: formyltetrahydrofolate-dependent phosphoribosylglycinamide formyltransferase [Candidatus Kentron sp. H]VFK03631.1 MAG: formyltetrahydrofolate-dependent phosphoribosylglycinamide formyltransferase [Candidatus Kentron sp. H]VFK06387.1 MAG: formyltetrahydrofolate-dependent phosphoribosylglycinamide formyltransferase [Candidatus Kentron sp. H]
MTNHPTEKDQNGCHNPRHRFPIIVLISGRGSNLQAIIDAAHRDLPVEIRAVISNQTDAFGLERARRAGIETAVLDHRSFPNRGAFDRALTALVEEYEPGLVVLAGFMRILTPAFVTHFQGRLINIHPALLPQLPGLDTHARAIAQGLREHGATVHFVTEEVDAGPIIRQARVPVLPDDTPETLAARVLEQEHRIFPQAIRQFVENQNARSSADPKHPSGQSI